MEPRLKSKIINEINPSLKELFGYRNMYMGLQLDLIRDRVDVLFKFYRTIKQGYSKYKFVQNTGDIKLWTGDF